MEKNDIEQLKADIKDLRWRWAVWTLYKVDKFIADNNILDSED